jgi:hypothetical protein
MINDTTVAFTGNFGKGKALVWIIDGDCLYDLALDNNYADMFLSVTSAEDVSSSYPDHDGISVRLFKDTEVLQDFCTSEYFGSILLSNPLVLNLGDYAYGRYVMSPDAKFDGEKFIILNQDVSELAPFFIGV